MNYVQYFFNLSHLFSLRPNPMSERAVTILLVIFGAMIIAAVVAAALARSQKDGLKKKAFRKVYASLLTVGLLGLVYVFFAWQGVALLAARFWLLVLAVVLVTWLGFIAKYFFKDIPLLRQQIDSKRNFQKYLP